jgi:hypothetical protein
MLQQEGAWNDLSPKLRERLTKKVLGFGKSVRYKFDISHPDPDPEKRSSNGVIYPFMYTLDPITFSINDKEETRAGKQQMKKIGIVEYLDEKNNIENSFRRVRIRASEMGFKKFDLTNDEDVATVMYLELHPKLSGGDFADKNKNQMFSRVDELKSATDAKEQRRARVDAMAAATSMSDSDVIQFADAMQWDSTEESFVLRNRIEELAELTPEMFNDLVKGKKIEYQALVKRAIDKQVINFDPAEYKFKWSGNDQIIAIISPVGERSEIEKMAEWLQAGGQKEQEVYKKIKSLVESK